VTEQQSVKPVGKTLRRLSVGFLGITLPALIFTAIASEGIFRTLLFSKIGFMEKFRQPGLYFDYDSEDNYWKLFYYLNGTLRPPENPHPLLGWVGYFSRETYLHDEASQIEGRKVVLLYGDSFAGCLTPKEECFEGVLNADDEFAASCYLLNYGVCNYDVDQIFLLRKNSLEHYQNSFVIVSLLVHDVDRSMLSVRVGKSLISSLSMVNWLFKGSPSIRIRKNSLQTIRRQSHPIYSDYGFRATDGLSTFGGI
jgi:hypothetical protein